ncbi:MAG: M20 metallopeptidase family protein [Galactobacter sp.]
MPIPSDLAADVIEFRRELHTHPEVDLRLPRTQAAVLARLTRVQESLPEGAMEITTGSALDSVVVVLRGSASVPEGHARPVVLLRGDMDALPVAEETGLPFASTNGAMHACGHDLHTAGLYGALAYLASRRDELVADVVGMFQPAEETDGGAHLMIQEGLLEAAGRRVDHAYALHVASSRLPGGVFESRAGTHSAGCDDFIVTVQGRGGHGSRPQDAADPVPVAAEMVLALQTFVTRNFAVREDPVVVTVGRITAGTAANIIPDTAEIAITMRSFSRAARSKLVPGVEQLVRGIASAHGMDVSIKHDCQFPVTVNEASEVAFVESVVRDLFGDDSWQEMEGPGAGSEDFSCVLDEVSGAYFDLGAVPVGVDPATAPSGHSANAVFDDSVIPRGVEVFAELALRTPAVRE